MLYRTFLLMLSFSLGCNTFADPEPAVAPPTDTDGGVDASTDSGVPDDMDVEGPPRFEITDLKSGVFDERHLPQTDVAIVSDGESGHTVSLAYLFDINQIAKNHGFIASTPVDTLDFSNPIRDELSENSSFESVTVVRDPERPTEVLFSVAYDKDCLATSVVNNTLHKYGVPGATMNVIGNRDCDTPNNPISSIGNVRRFAAVDGDVRYAIITREDGVRSLSTSTTFNSIYDYVEIEHTTPLQRGSVIHAAPGLIGTFDLEASALDLWSGVEGETPVDGTADPATQTTISLIDGLEDVALSGVAPERYEVWGAAGTTLHVLTIPCLVSMNPQGHLECLSNVAAEGPSTTFDGTIVELDATRSGSVAVASVLTRDGNEHRRHIVVYDGEDLEVFEIGEPLGDFATSHISVDVFQVSSDDRLVAIATTYLLSGEGSTMRTDVNTFRLRTTTE